MPCHSAIVDKLISVRPDELVENVLALLQKNKISAVPVIDEDGLLIGVFSMSVLLRNLIPVSVAMTDGVQMDITVAAAPGVAKRLQKVKPLPVSELMDRKFASVGPDSPIWEGVSLLTNNGSPLPVIDDAGKCKGVITYDSLVKTLEDIQNTGE